MATTVAELQAIITADTSQFDSAVSGASEKLNELSGTAGQANKGVQKAAEGFNASGKLMAAAGAALLAPMVDAVRGAATLEQAMDQVKVAFNATDEQAAMLEDTILDVASSTIFGAKDVADAANILGKAGTSVEDVTGGMLQAVADFAAATDTQLPTAADIFARTAAQWGISGEEMMGVADDLTTIFNETALSAEDWLGGMANFAPIMRLSGASLEETGAAMGFFKDQGLSAREAGTSLTRAMDAMIAPTDKQAEAMANLGITTEDFFEIGEDGQRQFIGWADTFDMLNEKMAGLDDIQKAAALSAIFGKEAFDAMGLGMLADTDKLRALNKAMEDNTGIARKQSDALTDNLLGSLEELGGAYDKLRVKMGDPFLDPLQAGVEKLTDLTNAASEADPALLGLAGKFATLTGGLLGFGGLAALGTGQVLKLGKTFSDAGLSLGKFTAGLGLAGLAIGAGLLAYETNFLGFRDTVDGVMEDAGKAVDAFGRSFDEAFSENKAAGLNDIAAGIAAFGTALNAAIGQNTEMLRRLAEAAQVFGDTFEEGARLGLDPWVNGLQSASRALRTLGPGPGGLLANTADELENLARAWGAMEESMRETEGQMPQLNRELSALQAGAQELTGLPVEQFFDDLGLAAATAQDDLTDLKHALGAGDWSEVGQILMRDAPNIQKFFDNLGTSVSGLQENLESFDLGKSMQGMSDQLGTWFNDMGREILGGMDSMAGPGEREVKGIIPQLADNIVGGFEGLGDLVMEKLGGIGNPFEGVGQWLQDGMNEIARFFQPQEMPAGLGGAGFGDTSGIQQWFDGMIQGFVDAIPTKEDVGAALQQKGADFMQAIGDNILGPLGQLIFPSEDAIAAGEQVLGDPAKIGAQFGQALINSFTDPAFEESLNAAIDELPEETFSSTGAALLSAINTGMKTAMTEAVPSKVEGDLPTAPLGQQMVQTLADGLTTALQKPTPETFAPVAAGLLGGISDAIGIAMQEFGPGAALGAGLAGGEGHPLGQGIGQQMVENLATGLTDSITAAPQEIFAPVAGALGTQLSTALQTMQQATMAPGPTGVPTQMPGFGQQLVQGLATGLTDSITAAPPELFTPVAGALGTKLGEAMSLAAQQTQAPGPTGVPTQVPGVGTSMVQGLATGLTDSITAAPIETFHPVANALGNKLGESLSTVMTQTVGVGEQQGGPVAADAAGGIGAQMVQGLATGLQTSITAAPVETFTPVGSALGTKMAEALQTVVGGADGEGASDVGAQLGDAVGQMITSGVQESNWEAVGTGLSQKLGETLQTVAQGGGETDISQQLGDSVGQMLTSGVEQADFTGVGDAVSTQLTEQMDSAIADVSTQISDQMQQVTEAVTQAVEGMGEAVSQATESVTSAVESMSESIQGAVEEVSSAVEEMSAAVEDAASTMEEAASAAAASAEEMGSAAEQAASAVSAAMSEIAAAIEAAAGAAEAAAGRIVGALNQIAGAAAAASSAVNSVGSMPAPSGGAPAGGTARSAEIGSAIPEGMASGMDTGTAVVEEAARSLATIAYDTLADAVEMGSPAKRFQPIGAAVSQGFMKGMLADAKGRLKEATGKMAGAVESAMGKIKGAMSGAMDRVHSMIQQGMSRAGAGGAAAAQQAGAKAASGTAEGMASEERNVERAARKLWRKALRKLLEGVGAARFLGEEWAREFWEGMLDSNGTLEFAQYVTEQIEAAAENAVEAVKGRLAGLATQLEIIGNTIADLESELASVNDQLGVDSGQARIDAAQALLDAQRAITAELEKQFDSEFQAAHQAHVRAAQSRTVAAQADYEAKLRQAQATYAAKEESAIREAQLEDALAAVIKAVEEEARARLEAQKAELEAELAAAKQQQDQLLAAQHAAQVEYTQTVIEESAKRLAQLERERKRADDPQKKAELKAQIALERQRIEIANQLASALARQAAAQTPEQLAQANAQVEFLTAQLDALEGVDVGAMLEEIANTLSETASSMSSSADSMSSAADSLGSMDVAASMKSTEQAVAATGSAAEKSGEQMFSMGAKYQEVQDKMTAETLAFQEQFKAMVEQTAGIAGEGGEDIGLALSDGIAQRIQQGAPALQQSMLQGVQQGVEQTEDAADKGGDEIANTFGQAMRDQLGVQLPKVHQDILNGMTKAADATAKEASQGGKDVASAYGQSSTDKLKDELPKFQTAMSRGMEQGIRDTNQIASQGGRDIGGALSDGIRDGVRDRAQGIADEAANAVRDAVKAAQQAAKAKSPSREMMDVGDDMGLGLIYGLRGRRGEAREASQDLIYIPSPLTPTSSGGVSGRRAYDERHGGRPINIENLNLPGVQDPQQFIEALERLASSNGVASGR